MTLTRRAAMAMGRDSLERLAVELQAEVECFQAEVERLRADLGFYGFEGHWRQLDAPVWYWVGPVTTGHDPGSLAREALDNNPSSSNPSPDGCSTGSEP
jgi:hypothetical protein